MDKYFHRSYRVNNSTVSMSKLALSITHFRMKIVTIKCCFLKRSCIKWTKQYAGQSLRASTSDGYLAVPNHLDPGHVAKDVATRTVVHLNLFRRTIWVDIQKRVPKGADRWSGRNEFISALPSCNHYLCECLCASYWRKRLQEIPRVRTQS